MRIIKRVEPKPEVYKVTCHKCRSELEYEPGDIRHDQRDGSSIVCPVCKQWIGHGTGGSNYWADR
jgi:hypothetical protein